MARLIALSALPLVVAAATSCSLDSPGFGTQIESHCRGRTVVTCEIERSSGRRRDASCWEEACPAGMACAEDARDAACVHPNAPCAPDTDSVCLDGMSHRCVGGFAETYGVPCDEGQTCFDVAAASDGRRLARCVLEPRPCVVPWGDECRGNTIVTCADGYPIEAEECSADQRCVIHEGTTLAYCTFGNCTPELQERSARVCSQGVLGECDGGVAPTILRDCAASQYECTEQAGGGCAVSQYGPGPLEWTLLPAGVLPERGTAVDAFELLRREVTAHWYSACVSAGACPPCVECEERFHLDLPVEVDAESAATFCAWLGGRLPHAFEWDYAWAVGGSTASQGISCMSAVIGEPEWGLGCGWGEPRPACSLIQDITQHGVCDLAGNVSEWVLAPEGSQDPILKRGLSFRSLPSSTVVTPPAELAGSAGFRCARPLGLPDSG